MSKTATIGLLLFLVVFITFAIISNKKEDPQSQFSQEIQQKLTPTSQQIQPVGKQASFAIFTNGTFRVFTASMYHNLSEDVFIEASNPNIIKIKKAGTTWNDFFSTLPLKITNDCLITGTKETFCSNKDYSLKFYLNGERKTQILDQVIQDRDTLLITYGNESEATISKQIQRVPNRL